MEEKSINEHLGKMGITLQMSTLAFEALYSYF